MRKIAAYLLMSLDGVIESPDRFVREDQFDDVVDVLTETIADQDAILLGRTMFEEWSEFWPESDVEPFAPFINGHPKYVVSRSLKSVDSWDNSFLVGEAVADRLAELKAQPGGTIGVHGSVSLVNSLLTDGLLDELRLLIFPTLAGTGRRLFEGGAPPVPLDLTKSRTTPRGLNHLVFACPTNSPGNR